MPAVLTLSVAPLVTVAEESISVTVSVGAVPFQWVAGTNFSWSVLFKLSAVDAEVTEAAICTQLVPL